MKATMWTNVFQGAVFLGFSLLAESNVAAITAGPRIPLDELVEEGLRPLAERRASGKILVAPG